jgi:hypothetical protein
VPDSVIRAALGSYGGLFYIAAVGHMADWVIRTGLRSYGGLRYKGRTEVLFAEPSKLLRPCWFESYFDLYLRCLM